MTSQRAEHTNGEPGQQQWSPDALLLSESVQLFAERALTVQPGFQIGAGNAAALAVICRKLDGIPLALELAAARMYGMSLQQIVERIDQRLSLLAGGGRAELPRLKTLRATLDWSYTLLSEPERIALRYLSVFAGGWTLAAAEAVLRSVVVDDSTTVPGAAAPGEYDSAWQEFNVAELLAQLVKKSLVNMEEGDEETRYYFLETVRIYAAEKLRAGGETQAACENHCRWMLSIAERAEHAWLASALDEWPARLDREHANLRVAVEGALACA